jgi:hypothetical protein
MGRLSIFKSGVGMVNRVCEDARYRLQGTQAELICGTHRSRVTVRDISRFDAGLEECYINSKGVKATVKILTKPNEVERSCSVVRVDQAGHSCAIRFDVNLTDAEMVNIVPGYEEQDPALRRAYTSAEGDIKRVQDEIGAIQACRGNVFMATVGTTCTASLAVGGFVLQGMLKYNAVLFAAVVILSTLIIGILTSIEKARAINIRRAFIMALSQRVRKRNLGSEYLGWPELRDLYQECDIRTKTGTCPQEASRGSERTCLNLARSEAQLVNQVRSFHPGVFASFTSLTSTVYLALYVFCLVAMGYFAGAWGGPKLADPSVDPLQVRHHEIYLWIAFGLGVSLAPVIVRLRKHLLVIFIGAAATAVLKWCPLDHWANPLDHWWAYRAAAFVAGDLFSMLGWLLLTQTNHVLRGRHSLYSYLVAWSHIIMHHTCEASLKGEDRRWYMCQTGLRAAVVRWLDRVFNWCLGMKNN